MKMRLMSLLLLSTSLLASPLRAQAPPPANLEAESIRAEMQQMRADYEQRLQTLERRLRQLEDQRLRQLEAAASATNPPAPAAIALAGTNAVPTPTDRARAYAAQEFARDTESREWAMAQEQRRPIKERVEQVLKDFMDIGGYFRAGYGRDDEGGPQVPFQAPGAFAKYRLGNETENYGELIFGKNWYVPGLFSPDAPIPPEGSPTGPIARTQVRLAFYDPYATGTLETSLPEAWAEIGNVFNAQPSLKFWAGNRFYRRQDIHINDFFFYNMSGAGGGMEDMELPFGKLALAWIGNGQQSGVYSSDIAALPDPDNLAGFSKQSVILSLYDIPLLWGQCEFGVAFASETSGEDAAGQQASDSHGVAVTFLHTREHFLSPDGINKFSLQFGRGAAKTFTSGYETVTLTNGTFIVPDDENSWRFRVTESFVAQPSEHFSISPALVYQYTDYNNAQDTVQWFSAGVRPVYHFNKYFSLAFESGADYVDDSGIDRSGTLYKFTLAPQVSLGNKFFSRPVIRAYVTYADWTDSFEGEIGGNDYVDRTSGWAWGMQMEVWW